LILRRKEGKKKGPRKCRWASPSPCTAREEKEREEPGVGGSELSAKKEKSGPATILAGREKGVPAGALSHREERENRTRSCCGERKGRSVRVHSLDIVRRRRGEKSEIRFWALLVEREESASA